MPDLPTSTSVTAEQDHDQDREPVPAPVAEESLVEEVSIDGMCGVY